MPLIIPSNSISAGGYEVSYSTNLGDNAYYSRTPASASNRKTFTFSFWVKRSRLGYEQYLYCTSPSNAQTQIIFSGQDYFGFDHYTTGYATSVRSTQVFRDPSAWYHFMVAVDTTQVTASNRVKLYVNGSQITDLSASTYPSQDYQYSVNNTVVQNIGRWIPGPDNYYSGYFSEYCLIDGQALDPTSFGEFDADTGIWKPIDVSGLTFGTNGFYLDFATRATDPIDASGNGNNWSSSNVLSTDWKTDTPTNNFATLNPLDNFYAQSTFSEGNLKVVTGTTQYSSNTGTIGVSTGKWYWEVEFDVDNAGNRVSHIGIKSQQDTSIDQGLGTKSTDWGYRGFNGEYYNNATSTAYGNTYVAGDIISIALDLDNNKLYFGKNGTWQNSGVPTSGATGTGAISITDPASTIFGFYVPALSYQDGSSTGTFLANFGNPPFTIASGNSDANGYGNFEYAVPSGYYALCTKNLAEFG